MCDYTSLKGYSLNFQLSTLDHIFWAHLYIIHLVLKTYPKFTVKISPLKWINGEIFNHAKYTLPSYASFVEKNLKTFYANAIMKDVSKMFTCVFLSKTHYKFIGKILPGWIFH